MEGLVIERAYQGGKKMNMTLASLQSALEEYPDRLQRALTRQYKANIALKRIREQIEEAEAHPDSDDESGGDTEAQKLQISYEQKKAQLEVKVRQNPQDYNIGRLTDQAVRAVVQADEELRAIKEQLQQQERKRIEELRSFRMTRLHRGRAPKTSDSKLMAELHEAEEEEENANIEVQVLRATLDTYRMLTAILAGTKPVMNTFDIG